MRLQIADLLTIDLKFNLHSETYNFIV